MNIRRSALALAAVIFIAGLVAVVVRNESGEESSLRTSGGGTTTTSTTTTTTEVALSTTVAPETTLPSSDSTVPAPAATTPTTRARSTTATTIGPAASAPAWPLPSNASSTAEPGVYLVSADGSVLRRVGAATQIGIAISADSRRVAYLADRKLHLVDIAGGTDVTVAGLPGIPTYVHPEWSPDGSRIAVVALEDGAYRIYTVQADGKRPLLLSPELRAVTAIAWRPDGSSIAAASGNAVYRVPLDGRPGERLADLVASGGKTLRFAPDGTKLAYAVSDALVVMGADGAAPQKIASVSSSQRAFDWSPDSARIVHTRVPAGLAVVAADGSSPTTLTETSAHAPMWSRANWIGFQTRAEGFSYPVDVIRPDGTERRRLLDEATPGSFQSDLRWDAKGDFLVLTSGAGGDET